MRTNFGLLCSWTSSLEQSVHGPKTCFRQLLKTFYVGSACLDPFNYTLEMLLLTYLKRESVPEQLTSHDAVGEYQDVDVRRKLTYNEEHSSDDAAHDADNTTSEPVGKCTDDRSCHNATDRLLTIYV